MCGNNKLGRRYNFRFKRLLKRTIPSYQLHPLRTSYYILSSTIPYTQPLPSILSPPYHPHMTHPPCLYLSLSLLINYTLLSSPPPLSNPTDTDPSALLISLPIPLSNPTNTNSLSFSLSFSSLLSFFSLSNDLSLAFPSVSYAHHHRRLTPLGFAEQAAYPLA